MSTLRFVDGLEAASHGGGKGKKREGEREGQDYQSLYLVGPFRGGRQGKKIVVEAIWTFSIRSRLPVDKLVSL